MKEYFKKVPFFNFQAVERLSNEILNPYSQERWEQLKEISCVHKLSYKQKVLNKKKVDISNTFLDKLLKKELN